MIKISVNINKIATLRNSRGGNIPDVVKVAIDCERFGAEGITVHPRPDQRHIRYKDVFDLKPVLTTEFNIEGNPIPQFINLVLKAKPAQVTLVPDSHDALTSNAGWNTIKFEGFLREVVEEFRKNGIRTSIFVDPDPDMVCNAAKIGADRIELYTEGYASQFSKNPESAINPYITAAKIAVEMGLGINAGHDLNLDNLRYFAGRIPGLLEVSIGHALITDALYYGLSATIRMYLNQIK
jgi:pyridoxine 5-phosphate synthase